MQNIVYAVSYDLTEHHTRIKKHCCENGFSAWVRTKLGKMRKLPNTTLVGTFASSKQAVDTFMRLASEVAPGVVIEKVLAIPVEGGFIESNEEVEA
ncbi:hypothetical protein JY651_27760 [Pyxidicoccus parkwayensis]|jgi:hypothetical protein|uniref:Uncharacterized protein n=1 Tax=Pyxidicoccus parkwayensis TaxID=2813578 RepID=A0ABX7NJU6_9BACT|nr:hypothetical protein [Pyxidicoccus parkwaysis]QSQ19142.1 hypothetical protein JY651_27760 [Pyxidicoccus parkwaysis]